jgi:hypothetical protein
MNIDETNIEETNIKETNIEETNIEETNIEEMNIKETNIEETNIEEMNIEEMNIEEMNIEEMNIEETNIDVEILKEAGYTSDEITEFLESKNTSTEVSKNNTLECQCINGCKSALPRKLPIISDIEFVPQPKFLAFKYKSKELAIKTPRLFVPFGIDKYYEHWSINFELKNLGCDGIKEFKQFLLEFEKKVVDVLETNDKSFNSQLNVSKNSFKFYGRIRNEFNKPACEIKDLRRHSTERHINIYNFPKGVWIKALITSNGLWKMNNVYCYKYHVKKVDIVD